MTLSFKTSADKVFQNLIEGDDQVKPKYSFTSETLLDGFLSFELVNETDWGVNKDANVKVNDTFKRQVKLVDFVYANVNLATADAARVYVENAKRGDIVTGKGDDLIEISIVNSTNAGQPGWGAPNVVKNSIFNVNSGEGNDVIKFTLGEQADGDNLAVSNFTFTNIDGGKGNDYIDTAGESPDRLFTIDNIKGGDGDDTIFSGGGDDMVDGGMGNDSLVSGGGNDTVYGGDGDDTVFANSGNDSIDGGIGNDYLDGGTGNDYVYGGEGDDVLRGRPGDDTLDGGEGNDQISGNTGQDTLIGGDGEDTFLIGSEDLIIYDAEGNFITYTVDTINDFDHLEGDVIDVFDPSAYTNKVLVGSDTLLVNDNGGGILVKGILPTDFDLGWLV